MDLVRTVATVQRTTQAPWVTPVVVLDTLMGTAVKQVSELTDN